MNLTKTSVKFILLKKIPYGNFNFKEFKRVTKKLINEVFLNENGICNNLNIIFCDDNEIKQYNRKYLNHDYETDIITFRYEDETVDSDVIISLDSVKRNAQIYGTGFKNELFRVIIHGVLHLCGYDDRDRSGKFKMRIKENKYLKFKDVL